MRPFRLAFMLSFVLVAGHAHAQSYDQGEAQRLFDEGKRQMAARQYEAAILTFTKLAEAYPSVGALFNVGEANERMNRPQAAWAAYAEAEKLAHAKLDPRKKDATSKMAALEPRLARLVVQEPASDQTISVREPVPEAEWNGPLRRAPGSYELTVKAPCRLARVASIKVKDEGGEIVVAPLDPDPECTDRGKPMRIGGYATMVGGALSLIVGTIVGVGAISRKSDLDVACGGTYDRCIPTNRGVIDALNDDAHSQATAATVFITLGAVLAAGGLVLVLAAPKMKTSQSAVWIHPAGMTGSF